MLSFAVGLSFSFEIAVGLSLRDGRSFAVGISVGLLLSGVLSFAFVISVGRCFAIEISVEISSFAIMISVMCAPGHGTTGVVP
jgi:hypothetical protein